MADPTIETFCCQRSSMLNESLGLLTHFNSKSYNTVCLASSSVGIIGAVYQILPRENLTLSHRWYSPSATRGRHIIVWLAVADLLASVGVFMRSFLFNYTPSNTDLSISSGNVLCAVSSAWIQYFYTATWLWTLFYAIDMKLVLREEDGHPLFYHSIVWIVPGIFTAIGLSVLYFPDAEYEINIKRRWSPHFYHSIVWIVPGIFSPTGSFTPHIFTNCHCVNSFSSVLLRLLPNYIATYLPLATVMILNPILYFSLSHDVKTIITRSLAQFTNKERQIVDVIKVKFLLINFAFYLCWLPNLINGILIWDFWFPIPREVIVMLWYIMALMNPLQAVFNSLLYRRWTGVPERVYIPCRKPNICVYRLCTSNTSNKQTANETSPLLSPSINSTCDTNDQHL